MSDDEFDNIPDDFADVQDVDWAEILGAPSAAHAATTPPPNSAETLPVQAASVLPDAPAVSNDSSSYFSDDDGMDSGFLAELDRLEQTLTHGQPVASSTGVGAPTSNATSSTSDRRSSTLAPQPQSHRPSEIQNSRHFPNAAVPILPSHQKIRANWKQDTEHDYSVPSKRPRSEDPSEPISPRSKGKMKVDDRLQQILSSYEDELTCPICCDLFVESHAGNPCGHNFCGDCGWQWYFNNAANRCCPCCRTTLDATTPMIPNISMNNTVAKHVKALALSGQEEWEPGGRKHKDWMARKQAWRDGAKKREKMRQRQRAKPLFSMEDLEIIDAPENWFYVQDDGEEDPTYEDSDVELIPRPIRRPQRRRQRGGG